MNNNIYQRAEQFFPWNLQHNIFNSTIFPYWTKESLYYFQDARTERWLIKVDIKTGKKERISDFQKLINALSDYTKDVINTEELTADRFYIQDHPLKLCFTYQKKHWSYDLQKHVCILESNYIPEYLISPDHKWALRVQDYNLFLKNLTSDLDEKLTTDGERYYDYASSPETNTRAITQRLSGMLSPPIAIWSPDSLKIVTHKLNQTNVDELHLMQNAPDGSQRPKLHSYKMSFSGDTNLPLAELLVIDVLTKNIVPLKMDALLSPYLTPIEFKWVWWSHDSQKVYFLRETRGSKELILCVADAITGEVHTLITETAQTYVEPSPHALWPHQVIILSSQEIIWLSQRSGYSHLYLYNMGLNTPKSIITRGDWSVREVHYYDKEEDWLFFTACGYERNFDPYYKQLFRCRLDGSELECLTKENAHHIISKMEPRCRSFNN